MREFIKNQWMWFALMVATLISILMRDGATRDTTSPQLREELAESRKETVDAEAKMRRARALAAREQLRSRRRGQRKAELLRRARGSKRGGG